MIFTPWFFKNQVQIKYVIKLHIIGSAYANAILGKEDHTKMVKYLIDNGSEVNAVTNAGNTALGFAAR